MSAGGFAVSALANTRPISETTRSISTCSPISPMATSKNSASLSATVDDC